MPEVPAHFLERARDHEPKRNRHQFDQCLFPRKDYTFLATHKCGRTTAAEALGHGLNWQQYLALDERPPVVAMWRDPFERLESTYRWAMRKHPEMFYTKGEPYNYMFPRPAPFSAWVASACKSWFDAHLKSQTWLNTGPNGEQPDMVIRWDWGIFAELFHVEVGHHNATDKSIQTEWDDAARATFASAYADDIETWNDGKYHTPSVGGDFAILPPLDCGTCGACCEGLGLILDPSDGPQVRQPVVCPHFDTEQRNCSIYAGRPPVCRTFDCRLAVNDTRAALRIRAAGLRRL